MHSLDDNKALVRRAIGYNHGAADEGAEIFAADFVAYMPGQAPMDRATFEHFVGGVTNGMPGYTYEIHDQIAQGDLGMGCAGADRQRASGNGEKESPLVVGINDQNLLHDERPPHGKEIRRPE